MKQEKAHRLMWLALKEFAPEWTIAGPCVPVSLADPDHWLSGSETFGFVLRHRLTGATRVLGKRRGGDPAASYHRGVSSLVLEAYEGGSTDPMRRYAGEIGVHTVTCALATAV
ncbi:MAG: hypothetical protein HY294_07400 [Candidatus Rokubacteria bacterium]|nr:hypothetical protein [Candidatus Rokubacteria bacterium]MBI3825803.1 hypothetical protein [Candidatus Rokubacteria bacterium]